MKTNFFYRGQQARKKLKAEQQRQKAQAAARSGPPRWWLPADTTGKLTFLDNPDFFLYEHNIQLGGRWGNHFTCVSEWQHCPFCEAGYHRSFVAVCTVISHRPFTKKDGTVVKHQKQLLVLKGKAREKVLKHVDRRRAAGNTDGLRFIPYEVSRGTQQTEASTGEDWEALHHGKPLAKEQLMKFRPKDVKPEDWLKPFDYEKIFTPLSSAELRAILGDEMPIGSDEADEIDDDAAADIGDELGEEIANEEEDDDDLGLESEDEETEEDETDEDDDESEEEDEPEEEDDDLSELEEEIEEEEPEPEPAPKKRKKKKPVEAEEPPVKAKKPKPKPADEEEDDPIARAVKRTKAQAAEQKKTKKKPAADPTGIEDLL